MLMVDNHRVFKSIQRASWSEWGLIGERGEGKKSAQKHPLGRKSYIKEGF